jgi:hypothetical protein
VEPLAKPVERAFLPANGVLLRIRPEGPSPEAPSPATETFRYPFTPEEEEWVRGGGRLVIAVDRGYGTIDVQSASMAILRKVFPVWPGVERLDPPTARTLRNVPDGVSLFAAASEPAIVRSRRGAGEIVLCAMPEIFQNGALPKADHLALLDRLASTGRPVFFDEHAHGAEGRAGTVEILRQWGFGPFLVLAGLCALVSFWRRRVRIGPEEDDARETRIEAVDFVDSLSLLYRRMLPRRHALTLYAREFERAVGAQTGLRDAALKARVAELLPPRPARPVKGKDLPVPEFEVELERINSAFRRLNDAKRSGNRRPAAAGPRPA